MGENNFSGVPQRLRLTPEDVKELHQICPARTYLKGESLYRAGEAATHLLVVVQGRVQLVVPGPRFHEHVLGVFGEHDFIGELFLAPEARYQANAIVLSDRAMACPVSRDDYVQLAMRVPRFVLSFSEVLTGHLAACRQQLSLAAFSVRVRVAHALLEEAAQTGTAQDDEWLLLQHSLTHEELASRVRSTRVTVTQVMSALRDEGVIDGARGHYRLNKRRLRSIVDDQSTEVDIRPANSE